jgi:hypothetical protein
MNKLTKEQKENITRVTDELREANMIRDTMDLVGENKALFQELARVRKQCDELLAGLRFVDHYCKNQPSLMHGRVHKEAQSAIAKAEGRAE